MTWKMLLVSLITAIAWNTDVVVGYGGGAPAEACVGMTPGHGPQPLDNNASPYLVTADRSEVKGGEELTVTIGGGPFLGFLVQVRDAATDEPVGTFKDNDVAKPLKCQNKQDTLTHRSPDSKSTLELTWMPPAQWAGQVKVLASVVIDYSNYYVKLPSAIVQVAKGDPAPEPEPEPDSEPEPEAEGEAEPDTAALTKSPAAEGCGQTKTCFGMPAECERSGSCDYMFSWRLNGDKVEWEGYRKGAGYVGVGISEDAKMGEDIMFLCTKDGAAAYTSLGRNKPNGAGLVTLQQIALDDVNGNLYCKFSSAAAVSAAAENGDELEVDMKTNKYHILLARGEGALSYHGQDRTFSGEPVSVSVVSGVGAGSNLLLKLHGFCMIAAWLGCAATGIIVARYYKQTWTGNPVMGKDRWFQAHRTLMSLAGLLTILGLILVFAFTGGWHYSAEFIRSNPHPVLGMIVSVLAIINPIMALFRPHPGTSSRKYFNWAHWFVGTVAFNLGIAAIFLAGNLGAVNIQYYGWLGVLITWVVIYTLVHLALGFGNAWAQKKKEKSEVHPMSEKEGGGAAAVVEEEAPKDLPGSKARKLILLFFFLFSVAIVAAASAIIFMAE